MLRRRGLLTACKIFLKEATHNYTTSIASCDHWICCRSFRGQGGFREADKYRFKFHWCNRRLRCIREQKMWAVSCSRFITLWTATIAISAFTTSAGAAESQKTDLASGTCMAYIMLLLLMQSLLVEFLLGLQSELSRAVFKIFNSIKSEVRPALSIDAQLYVVHVERFCWLTNYIRVS